MNYRLTLVLALVVLGAAVSLTVVPGVFTVDDNNYLINVLELRHGRVTVANTEGLPPSSELLFFDPGPWSRKVESTPVASTAPPLYALVALPFVWLGWRGLVALNTLAYLATAAMVFLYARRYASADATPWLAAVTFALCGFSIEYAQGVWPHSLSVALCLGGVMAAGQLIETGRLPLAAASGFLLALAAGIRYQDAVVLAAALAAVVLWAPRRWYAGSVFALASAVPLTVSSVINHARLHSWNPVSKGPGYLTISSTAESHGLVVDALTMFWAMVIDYSVRPRLVGRGVQGWVTYVTETGAHLIVGIIPKKALLQSAPWAALALCAFVLVWLPRFRTLEPVPRRRQLQLLSWVTFVIVAVFALAGVRRHDGLAFNQRYLLEVVPFMAIAFAWALDGMSVRFGPLLIGCVLGVAVVLLILLGTPIAGSPEVPMWLVRQSALLKLPLIMAVTLGALWLRARSGRAVRAMCVAIGICLGWAFTQQLAEDVFVSQHLRGYHLARTKALAGVLTDGTALVAHWGGKDPAGPLLFDRDIVILDAAGDEGKDAPMLIRELLRRNRKVFFLEDGFPPEVRDRVLDGFESEPVTAGGVRLLRLRSRNVTS